MQTTVQTALDTLGKALGVADLTMDADNRAAVAVDDVEIGIQLSEDTAMVQLFAIIGPMPDAQGPELFRVLLGANHMGAMTGGAAVGLDAGRDLLTLTLSLPVMAVTGDTLAAGLETVANVTAAWRSNLPLLAEVDAVVEPVASKAIYTPPADWMRM